MEDLIRRSDAISRKGVSAWLDNMGYPRLANAVMDEKRFPSADRPQGVYDAIALVNRETEREDLSEEIKKYLFCDLRKKLWGLDSRPQGEWIDRGMRVPCSWVKKCSLCGHETDTWRWCNFCPNCGARMKGADGEN